MLMKRTDLCSMAPIWSATVKFSGSKSSFLNVPESWITSSKLSLDVHVFEIKYGKNCSAFLSYKGGTSHSKLGQNEIQLSRKYGLLLGLKEDEEILVEHCEKNIAVAEKVVLEPFASDDWEIMSLNSKMIESDLLNQIRIVWKGQTFPVWVLSSSFSVKVVDVIPEVEPVMLAEWTEVHIIPKGRTSIMSTYSSTPIKRENAMFKKYKHLRPHHKNSLSPEVALPNSDMSDDSGIRISQNSTPSSTENQNESSSVFSIFQNMVKTVFAHSDEHSSTNLSPTSSVTAYYETESAVQPISLRLRVIPYSQLLKQKALLLALQATTIFISDQTLISQCHVSEVPLCFVASISKLISPTERQEKMRKPNQSAKLDSKNKLKKEKEESAGDKQEPLFSSMCVTVVVVHSFDKEYDLPESLHLPLNYVAVPKELKRCLGTEVTSVVHCESVKYQPIFIETLHLRPLSALPPHIKEESVVSAFVRWANDALNPNTSLLVSDGTLVSLPVAKGKPFDFAVSLGQLEGLEASNKNLKPGNNLSSSSSRSESLVPPVLPLVPQYGFVRKKALPKIAVKLCTYSAGLSKSIWCATVFHKVQDLYPTLPGLRIDALGGVKSIFEKAMEDFMYWLKLNPVSLIVNDPTLCYGSMLICGPKGVGKSTLTKALCRKLSEFPHYVCTKVLDCRPLRGKRVENVMKKWAAALAEAVHREPSVIVFDDLDQLASAPATPEQEVGPDGIYFLKIAQAFMDIVNAIICQQNKVVVVATSKSIHTLHPSLVSSRGCHTFLSVLEVPLPGISERADILQSLILSKVHLSSDSLEALSFDDLAQCTEGYIAQDLDVLVDKATHAALLRTEINPQDEDHLDSEQIILCDEDFQIAMEGYTPSSLRGLQLHQRGTKMWRDVGGLHQVKKTIQQIMWWPVKYPKLISKCPIKPQSNILLFGAPGTGKTLLASVVANECGLNFISIKGPELLSKYVGASEEAVRNLFQRALSAKPCIIFFDEFDAIAPKRGHDSTGVTDRVVNQFLTQMDGVESAQGVYVLAASSRPDLIDPALLRPGRLDKCLHCPLPDEIERLEILMALSVHLTLSDDVNFETISKATENFSGADLQALLYSSQLQAFHDIQASKRRMSLDPNEQGDALNADKIYMPSLLEGPASPSPNVGKKLIQEINIIKDNIAGRSAALLSKRGPRKHSFVSIVIQQRHLETVLSQMAPSVSASERQRYQAIYDKFMNSHGGDFTPPTTGLKKVTLA